MEALPFHFYLIFSLVPFFFKGPSHLSAIQHRSRALSVRMLVSSETHRDTVTCEGSLS